MSSKEYNCMTCLAFVDPDNLRSCPLWAPQTGSVPLQHLPTTENEMAAVLQKASLRGLIKVGQNGRLVQMHRVTQQHLQALMSPEQKLDAFNSVSVVLLSQWPSRKKFTNCLRGFWPEFDDLYSNVHHLSESRSPSWSWASWDIDSNMNRAFPKLLHLSAW